VLRYDAGRSTKKRMRDVPAALARDVAPLERDEVTAEVA
jgi:hypothetical protein